MKNRIISRQFLAGFMAVILWVVIVLAQGGMVKAGGSLTPPGSIDALVVIPAAAFHSDGWDPDSAFFEKFGGYITGNISSYGCVVAPVYLPRGVRLTSFSATIYDNDASNDLLVQLHRINIKTGVKQIVSFAGTESSSDEIKTLYGSLDEGPVVPPVAYFATGCLKSSDLRLYSVGVYYEHSLYLPLIKQ